MNIDQSSLQFLYQAMLMSITIATLHVAKPRRNPRNVTRGKRNLLRGKEDVTRDQIYSWLGHDNETVPMALNIFLDCPCSKVRLASIVKSVEASNPIGLV